MPDLSQYSTEELLRMKAERQGRAAPESTGLEHLSTEELLDMKARRSAQPSGLASMRFEPEVAPAVTTGVSPDFGESPQPRTGLLPKGTGEAFERALPQWPVTEDLSTGQKALRTAGNLALGAAKFPVRMGTALLEDPLSVPRGIAEFVPSVVNRLSTAAPGPGLRRFGPEFTGREVSRPAKEDVSQARRELMEEPFDVALLALPALKKLKAPKPKVKAPVVEAVKPKQIGVGEKGKVVGKKEVLKGKSTELGFMGVTPGGVKGLGESTTKAMRSVSAATSQMITEVKTPSAIAKGAKIVKETLTEHDRQIRRSEATSALLKQTVKAAIPKADRQMLVAHAIEHKMKGPFWDRLTTSEREIARQLSGEKTKLDQFVAENKILEMLPESEKIRHLSHFWIDPQTGKPFKAMYGKFSKGLPQAKQRTIQDYATGMKATPDNPLGLGKGGMKPSTTNPGEMIGLGWEAAMRAHQSRQAIKTVHNIGADPKTNIKLTVTGKPRPIRMLERWDLLEKQGLTEGYTRYSHYALDKAMTFKDASGSLVRLKGAVGIRNEIYPHLRAYMENPTYNVFDRLVSVSRSSKLGLSMFHVVSLAAQEAALSIGKAVTGHPIEAAKRIPFTSIPRGVRYRKTLGPVERLLYQEGLELFRHSEQMGEASFFKGVGIFGKAGNVMTYPMKAGRNFIFGVVQPGMKTAFAHDTFLSMLPKYLKDTKNPATGKAWTTEEVMLAYDAGKPIPIEALKAARQTVQMADGHFSGEHWRRSLLETNRFMAKAYFSPGAQTAWNRGLLSKTWQREHLLVAKNVAKSFMPNKLIEKMKLSEIHPAAKAEYRQYLYGAVTIVGAVDLWNLMTTEMMDGEAKHLWENPPGKGFAVRAPWNEPDYEITTKDGDKKTIKGGAAYIRPLKSLFEVAEWGHHPVRKFSYKLTPYLTAIIAQMPNNKYRNYEGMKDVPKRAMDFMFDVFEPISIDQMMRVARGQKTPQAGILPFFGMPTSKLKEIQKAKPTGVRPVRRGRIRPGARR